ncbi:hypothetical protein F8M41_023929 [Gigaspora margarita]|uniref:C2H2-type domain-containing protein n=1 Tax=Gigaspora margarita TaxID=4874 RepID=A0A8H4EGB3_GIGMA|nr:hypothetical protein F8M41_023929 [Gigaspora margarita]
MSQSYNKPFEYTICKKKWYKSAAGLLRHENAKHSNYNISPVQHYTLPENAVKEWKEMLVHSIHKRFSLAFQKTGKQVIKFPCMKGQYLGLFGQFTTPT